MGTSEPPRNGDFSIGDFAEDVAAVANTLGFRRFVLVGHSLGGRVLAACAGLIPGLLDFDAGAALKGFRGPMLHVHSGFLEEQNLEPIHAPAPGIEATLVEDCSHWVHMDQPDLFNVQMDRFLERHAPQIDRHPKVSMGSDHGP